MAPISLQRTRRNARIVIIGSGPSGISTATRLLENGFGNVIILEAENRIGGRINTRPFADNVVDLGAQWCHGEEGNVVYQRVKDLNLLESSRGRVRNVKRIRSNGEIIVDKVAEQLRQTAFDSVPKIREEVVNYEGSLGSFLTDRYWQKLSKINNNMDQAIAAEFLENFKRFQCALKASDHTFDISGQYNLQYWVCGGDLELNWRGKGYRNFLNVLMQSQNSNELGVLTNRVHLNRRVQNIDWSNPQRLLIRTWNGEIFEADHIICTVSLGVLKENYRSMFSPMLPNPNCRAIKGLKFGIVNKFFLEFAKPFEPLDWTEINFLWREQELSELRNSENFWLESVFTFHRVEHQPRLLNGAIIGEHARYMETLPESEVLAGILWLLRKFLNTAVPEPLNFIRTQWYSNPNFRGSYSFRSVLTDERRTGPWDLAKPVFSTDGRLLLQFAGEATHSHYFSTVHGATETGYREADRLIQFYAH